MSERILRYKETVRTTGLSRTTLWRLIRQGLFPKPLALTNRVVGFRESDVTAWIAARAEAAKES
jgi:prophage regulatory protein